MFRFGYDKVINMYKSKAARGWDEKSSITR